MASDDGGPNAASLRWQALRPSSGPSDVDVAITQPVPRGKRYQFSVTRHRNTSSNHYIAEKLSADLTRTKFVMAARSEPSMTKTIFVLSTERDNFDQHSQQYVGKIKSNMMKNAFSVLDAGYRVRARTSPPDVVHTQSELASILLNSRTNHPRAITVILPAMNANTGQPLHVTTTSKHDALLEKYRNDDRSEIIVLRNKTPVWDQVRGTYTLDFFGRVLQASIKNFQLIDDRNDIVLQFGRRSREQFALDFTYPLNTKQAFGIALSVM